MKHIDEFTIHAFRGLRDVKLEGLGQINLLVGENNSGKTSVLEALSIFCDSFDRAMWQNAASLREVNFSLSSLGLHERLHRQLIWLFPQEEGDDGSATSNTKSKVFLSASGSFPVEEVSGYYDEFYKTAQFPVYLSSASGEVRFENREVKGIKIYVSSSVRQAAPVKSKLVNTELEFFYGEAYVLPKEIPILPVQIVNPFSHRFDFDSTPSRRWSAMVDAETESDTLALLQTFDKDIEHVDIMVVEDEVTVYIKHRRLGRTPLSTFGDGLRRVFTLATALIAVRGGLLLIDELEMAIHTDVLGKTFNWLVKACIQNNVQLFATTHSLETVDAVINASRDETIDLVAYRLELYKGQKTVTRLDKPLLTRLRANLGMEVR